MDELLMSQLQATTLNLSVQVVANHQTTAHLADLASTDKLTTIDIAESFATQGLQYPNAGRDAIAGTIAGGGYPAKYRTAKPAA